MNDVEDRLRTELHELADTVPPSQHARADLRRRIVRRRTRRSTLAVVAAAVVVVAGVAIPVTLNQDKEPVNHSGSTTRPATSLISQPGISGFITYDIAPIVLGRFTEDGVENQVRLFIGRFPDETAGFCVGVMPPVRTRPEYDVKCEREPTWPTSNPPGHVVSTHALLDVGPPLYSGPTPNLMLFITSPQVTSLEVTEGGGRPVTVKQVTKTQGATYYLADFPETPAGFGYVARDAAGNILESAIT
jgi:hypothetical protein